jgi:hypothetical protein
MALKYFTNAFKGNASDSIVIKNLLLTKKNVKVATGTTAIKEDILTVVARLNERD